MAEHTPFLTIFPFCADLLSSCGGLDKAYVTDVQVRVSERSMTVSARFPAMPLPVELNTLRRRLEADYALNRVELNPDYPAPAPAAPDTQGFAASTSHGDVLMGRVELPPVQGVVRLQPAAQGVQLHRRRHRRKPGADRHAPL